jgi:hypothetical protein
VLDRLADLSVSDAATILARTAAAAREKRAIDASSVLSSVKDWFASHPEYRAPLIGAGIGATLGAGTALARGKPRHALTSGLLGGLAGGGLGMGYQALQSGGDRTKAIDQQVSNAARDAYNAKSPVEKALHPVAGIGNTINDLGKAVGNTLVDPLPEGAKPPTAGEVLQDAGGRAAGTTASLLTANPLVSLGAIGGLRHSIQRVRDQRDIANFLQNATDPSKLKSYLPDTEIKVPGKSTTTTEPLILHDAETGARMTVPHPETGSPMTTTRTTTEPPSYRTGTDPRVHQVRAIAHELAGTEALPTRLPGQTPTGSGAFHTDPHAAIKRPALGWMNPFKALSSRNPISPLSQVGQRGQAVRNFAAANDLNPLLMGEAGPTRGQAFRAHAGKSLLGAVGGFAADRAARGLYGSIFGQ